MAAAKRCADALRWVACLMTRVPVWLRREVSLIPSKCKWIAVADASPWRGGAIVCDASPACVVEAFAVAWNASDVVNLGFVIWDSSQAVAEFLSVLLAVLVSHYEIPRRKENSCNTRVPTARRADRSETRVTRTQIKSTDSEIQSDLRNRGLGHERNTMKSASRSSGSWSIRIGLTKKFQKQGQRLKRASPQHPFSKWSAKTITSVSVRVKSGGRADRQAWVQQFTRHEDDLLDKLNRNQIKSTIRNLLPWVELKSPGKLSGDESPFRSFLFMTACFPLTWRT